MALVQKTARVLLWHSPWKLIGLLLILLLVVAIASVADNITSRQSSGNALAVQPFDTTQGEPAQQEAVGETAPAENPSAQTVPESSVETADIPATTTPLELKWVEIGRARNGDEVLALPIPWDRVVIDQGTANIPSGADEIIDFLRAGNYNLPPNTKLLGWFPPGEASFYLPEGDKVTLYAYNHYRWSEEDPQGFSYWEAETTLSEIKEAE